jgi:hypothetical protein
MVDGMQWGAWGSPRPSRVSASASGRFSQSGDGAVSRAPKNYELFSTIVGMCCIRAGDSLLQQRLLCCFLAVEGQYNCQQQGSLSCKYAHGYAVVQGNTESSSACSTAAAVCVAACKYDCAPWRMRQLQIP